MHTRHSLLLCLLTMGTKILKVVFDSLKKYIHQTWESKSTGFFFKLTYFLTHYIQTSYCCHKGDEQIYKCDFINILALFCSARCLFFFFSLVQLGKYKRSVCFILVAVGHDASHSLLPDDY